MGSEQGLGGMGATVVEKLRNGPGNGNPVEGRGSSPDFIENDETFRRCIAKDIGGLGHLHHERGLAAGKIVRCADPGENPVDHPDCRLSAADETADLRHEGDQRHLAHEGRFPCHVRAGDDQQLVFAIIEDRYRWGQSAPPGPSPR